MINDNNEKGDPWPERRIVLTQIVEPRQFDNEPYVQKLTLSCGHVCFNTYGNLHTPKFINENMGCRTCFINGKK